MAKKKIDMVQLRCDAIPTLLITTPHVQFEDGLATVTAADAEIILDVLGDDFGITFFNNFYRFGFKINIVFHFASNRID